MIPCGSLPGASPISLVSSANDFELTASNDEARVIIELAAGAIGEEDIVDWVRDHSEERLPFV